MMTSLDTIPDYYNLFKNPHNVRCTTANMAQIAGSRSEFMTSDLGLNDIDYKRKGGCFLSHNRTAAVIAVFVAGVVVAGFVGAYIGTWRGKEPAIVSEIVEEDEIDGTARSKGKFSTSSSVYPTLYSVELTPIVGDKSTTIFKGRVLIRFVYNGSEPLSQLVLNAKGIAVFSSRLFSLDNPVPRNVHSARRRRSEGSSAAPETSSLRPVDSSDVTNLGEVGTVASFGKDNSSTEDHPGATQIGGGDNATAVDDSPRENAAENGAGTGTSSGPSSTTASNVLVKERDKGETSSVRTPVPRTVPPPTRTPISTYGAPERAEDSSREISTGDKELDAVDGFYAIRLTAPIARGSYSVEITYEAKVDGRNTFSSYYDLEGQKRWLLAARFEPLGARTLFPGFHERNSRAKFSLAIARPKTLGAMFSTPLRSSHSVSENWTMDHFEITPPMSPDSLAFAVSDLQPVAEVATGDSNVPLTLWARDAEIAKTRYVRDNFGKAARVFSQYFSSPGPFPKLDVAVLPRIVDEGSGGAGLVFVGESLFDVTETSSPILRERAVMNIVELIGEQWLGGLVSAKSWTDAWFLRGSLIHLKHLLADKVDPTVETIDSIGIRQRAVREADSYRVSKSLKSRRSSASFEPVNLRDSFEKGACLIRMMHGVLSDSGLRNGYKHFLARWSNAETDHSDFFVSMSSDAHWIPEGASLAQAITSWVDQAGFPVVSVTRNYESGSALVRQERFVFENSTTTGDQLWYVPVTYVLDGTDDWSSPSRFWLGREPEVTVNDVGGREGNKWLLFNVNQTGYYRVNYDVDNWNLLAAALNSTPDKFPVATRTSLVDDALNLAWGERLGYSTALDLIRYLSENEVHHSPWTIAFENMVKLNNLLYDTPAYQSFQEFMAKFVSHLLKKVTASSVESQLKLIAMRWACLIDNPSCLTQMKSFFSVPVYLEETYRCALARYGGKSEWDSMISKISNSKDGETKLRLVAALPCFRVEWILQSLLDGLLNGGKYEAGETTVLLRSFGENPMAARSAFKFLRRNWNKIYEKYSKSYQISRALIIASLKGVTDDQDLKDFQRFKEEHRDSLRFMGHTIALAEAEAKSRSSWLKRNLDSVRRWMEEYVERAS